MRFIIPGRLALLVLATLLSLVGVTDGYADESDLRGQIRVEPSRARPRRLDREWALTLPIWVPGFDGSAAVGRVELSTDSGSDAGVGIVDKLFDAVTDLEFALMGAVRYRTGPWHFGVDAFHVDVGNVTEFKVTDSPATSQVTATVGRLWMGYRFARHATRWGSSHRPVVCDHVAYVGVRAYRMAFDSDAFGLTEVRRRSTWIDPLVGYRGRLNLRTGWQVVLNADVGGFGLGSEFSWSFLAGLEYRPSRHFSVMAAWSLLGVDYSVGLDASRFEVDVLLAGPHLALSLHL